MERWDLHPFDLILDGDLLVELKTAARAYDAGTLARHLQITAYAYAYRQVVGRDPTIKVVALLKTKKPRLDSYGATRTPQDDAWFVHLAVEVIPPLAKATGTAHRIHLKLAAGYSSLHRNSCVLRQVPKMKHNVTFHNRGHRGQWPIGEHLSSPV